MEPRAGSGPDMGQAIDRTHGPLSRRQNDNIIFIVVVLYNQKPLKSPAVSALTSVLSMESALASRFRILLYDHSPEAQQDALPGYPGLAYRHDATNEGLASAYNYALRLAVEQSCAWLLLLDQDTAVTRAYLEEAVDLTMSMATEDRIAAIVPKLQSAKGIKSPTLDFLEWLRRQVQFPRRRALYATKAMHGVQEEQYSAFNSASILRVSSLVDVGGFPSDFWLDFLDIAVFHALHAHGKRIFVMHACLQHELSMDTLGFYEKQSGLVRHRNLIGAMVHFVKTRGTARDRWLARAWLLRNALTLLLSARDKRFGFASLSQAVLMRPGDRKHL